MSEGKLPPPPQRKWSTDGDSPYQQLCSCCVLTGAKSLLMPMQEILSMQMIGKSCTTCGQSLMSSDETIGGPLDKTTFSREAAARSSSAPRVELLRCRRSRSSSCCYRRYQRNQEEREEIERARRRSCAGFRSKCSCAGGGGGARWRGL